MFHCSEKINKNHFILYGDTCNVQLLVDTHGSCGHDVPHVTSKNVKSIKKRNVCFVLPNNLYLIIAVCRI